jgi:acetolactate synthase-1/2/3 large subunit
MRSNDGSRSGGEILVDQLVVHGVRHAFCVPGESYLAALDAFHDSPVALTVCRQEGGAAMMAEAVGKATGAPGICFVTRGPGATNASPGIHIARQDSTPMIVFVGQVARAARGREAFQELDYRAVFGSMAKWATEIDDPARIPEIVSHAFHAAVSGRPGPVVVALPEDMLTERAVAGDAQPFALVETVPDPQAILKLQEMLATAQRPLVILGGSRWSQDAWRRMQRFAERFDLPVATTFRRGHLFDQTHANYAGDLGVGPNPKLVARIEAADLVILVGGRMGEIPSQGYTLFDIPHPRQTLVHVHPGAEELGRVYHAHLPVLASPAAFAAALDALAPPATIPWSAQTRAANADYVAFTETATDVPGSVNLGEIMLWLRGALSDDAILCSGAGNFSAWLQRFYRLRRFNSFLGPTSGSMGYGVPAAAAMQRLYPGRTVFCLAGDGDFLMNGQEFMTAVQYDLPVVVAVVDNGMYGTIRMHQEREYPGRVVATALKNPDFAAYARAFGGFGATVERTADFPAAFAQARASGKPSILHLKVDPGAITPATTLDAIRAKALAGRG